MAVIFQFPNGFSLLILLSESTNRIFSFNSLTDSHDRVWGILNQLRDLHFQFPNGFSLKKMLVTRAL